MESSLEAPQNIRDRSNIFSHNSTVVHLYKENEKNNLERCIFMFIKALFTIDKVQKKSKCPLMNEEMKKFEIIYMYIYIYIYNL